MDDSDPVNEYREEMKNSPKDDEHCEEMENSSKDNSDCENAFHDQSSKCDRNPTTLENQILSSVASDSSANEQSLSGTWSTTHNKSPTKVKTRKVEVSESHTSPPTPSIKKREIMKSSSDDSETANNALQSSVVFSTSTADTDSKSSSNLVTQESEVAIPMVEESIYYAGEKTFTSFGDSWTDSNSPAKLSNPDDLYQTRSFINVPTKEHGTTIHSIISTGDSIASANVDSENQRKGSPVSVSYLVEPGSSDPEFKSRPTDKVSSSGFEPTSNLQNSNSKDCKPCMKGKTQEFLLILSEKTQSVSNMSYSGTGTTTLISSKSDGREGKEISDGREGKEEMSDGREGKEEMSDGREGKEEMSDGREGKEEMSDGESNTPPITFRTDHFLRDISDVQGLLLTVLEEIMTFNEDEEWWKRIKGMYDDISKSPCHETEKNIILELHEYRNGRQIYWNAENLFTYRDSYEYFLQETVGNLTEIVTFLLQTIPIQFEYLDFNKIIIGLYKNFRKRYEDQSGILKDHNVKHIEDDDFRNKITLEGMVQRLLLQMKNVFQILLMLIGKLSERIIECNRSEKRTIDQYIEALWEEDKKFFRGRIY